MFAARCIGVSLAVFFLLYVLLSVAVSRGWPLVERYTRGLTARRFASLLFVLRILPLISAAVVTIAFTVPSFLLLEPRFSNEWIGVGPLLLGLSCVLLFGYGLHQAISAHLRTSHAVSEWLTGATAFDSYSGTKVYRTGKSTPTLTVVGLRESKVLVSEKAIAALSPGELGTALRHESAHIRSRDNLKKLVFRFAFFPGMRDLEYSWSLAAEMAADDEAVSSFRDALDLAAALIKLSRQAPAQPCAELATALLHSSTESLKARVQRLFIWNSARPTQNPRNQWWYAAPLLFATAFAIAMSYPWVLTHMHVLTEWLVQ
jgi:Zn-dependent protease with chaperone function